MGLGVTLWWNASVLRLPKTADIRWVLSILGGIGPRNRVREERMGARVLLFFNPEGCE